LLVHASGGRNESVQGSSRTLQAMTSRSSFQLHDRCKVSVVSCFQAGRCPWPLLLSGLKSCGAIVRFEKPAQRVGFKVSTGRVASDRMSEGLVFFGNGESSSDE
jgi:hypothetical protein